MAEVWVGKTDLGAAMRSKRIRINGPRATWSAACPTGWA